MIKERTFMFKRLSLLFNNCSERQPFFDRVQYFGAHAIFLALVALLSATVTFLSHYSPAIAVWIVIGVASAMVVLLALALPVPSERFAVLMLALFCVYIFLHVVWPRYALLRLPGFPGVSPARLVQILLLLGWFYAVVKSRELRVVLLIRMKEYRALFLMIGALLVFKILSIFGSAAPFVSAKGFANELISFYILLLIVLTFVKSIKEIRYVVISISAAALLVLGLGFYESIISRNLFIGLLDVNSEYLEQIFREKVRLGAYRVQSTFSHPLTLSEFITLSLPVFAILLLGWNRSFWKVSIYFVFSALSFYVIFKTGSRSGLGGFLVVQSLLILTLIARGLFLSRNAATSGLYLISLVLMATIAVLGVFLIGEVLIGRDAREVNSGMVRLDMWRHGFELALQRPINGYGQDQAAIVLGFTGHGGVITIDSYFLSVLLESGFISLLLFIGIILYVPFIGLRALGSDDQGAVITLLISVALIVFFLIKGVLSLTHNHSLVMVLIGLALISHLESKRLRPSSSSNPEPLR